MENNHAADNEQKITGKATILIQEDEDATKLKSPNPRVSRKRTKTGCLTCRRRRIKCGEERPRCGNCIKSKRQCEGYNQRVIFKDPMNTYRAPTSASSAASANTVPRSERPVSTTFPATSHYRFQPPLPPLQETIPNIVPRPNETDGSHHVNDGFTPSHSPAPDALDDHHEPLPSGIANRTIQESAVPTRVSPFSSDESPTKINRGDSHTVRPYEKPILKHSRLENLSKAFYSTETDSSSQLYAMEWNSGSDSAYEGLLTFYQSNMQDTVSPNLTESWDAGVILPAYLAQPTAQHHSARQVIQEFTAAPDEETSTGWPPERANPYSSRELQVHQNREVNFEYINSQKFSTKWDSAIEKPLSGVKDQVTIAGIGHGEYDAVMENTDLRIWDGTSEDDEDPFDVSGDELENSKFNSMTGNRDGNAQHDHLRNNDLGIVVALQAAQDSQDQSLRTYHSFINGYGPDILATYRPSARSSPLNDSMTARIFCHFINVTAPCISMYERHPANPSLIFQGRPVPKTQQHLWAYTMPTLALSNQALLHAMLAVGSLHMAKLQDGPITAPLKHYHIALRRVGKAVSLPTRRGQPATLAATLLLGWFEVMSADHNKWAGHVLGAKLLLQSVDFAGVTRYLKIKRLDQQQAQASNICHPDAAPRGFENLYHQQTDTSQYLPDDGDVNENLVGIIMGKQLLYDKYGQVLDDLHGLGGESKTYTQQDIETYETQRDLFWWFCKQDAMQSILGGNKIFMPYELWSHCPPRAAVGKRDAIYGTWDHLVLLLGRLAEFVAKDLKRKRNAMKSSGGQSQTMGLSSSSNSYDKRSDVVNGPSPTAMPQMPPFAGMLPGTNKKIPLPRGFSPPRENSPDSVDTDERPMHEQTFEAEEEWQEIHSAFNTLRDNFGPDYQALGPEYSQPIHTPFGPALQYRTFGIAGIWIFYYMGLIVLHRAHPTMPPAAMIAVGLAARQTGFYANEIGRIAAGIAPNASEIQQVNTGIGAALIESSFGLFVAGVQFQDSAQRSWTIQRCFDMRRLTGWQTGHSIAIGCETSWVKAAQVGKGPSYTRGPEWKTPSTALDLESRRGNILSGREQDASGRTLIVDTRNRVHYALGLLGVEDSFENLEIEEDGTTNHM